MARETGEPGRAPRKGDASAVLTVGGRVGQVNKGKGSGYRESRKAFQIKGIRYTETWRPEHLVGVLGAEKASREGQESRLKRLTGARLGKASCFLS